MVTPSVHNVAQLFLWLCIIARSKHIVKHFYTIFLQFFAQYLLCGHPSAQCGFEWGSRAETGRLKRFIAQKIRMLPKELRKGIRGRQRAD